MSTSKENRNLQNEENLTARMNMLYRKIAGVLNLDEVCREIANDVNEITKADCTMLLLANRGQSTLDIVASVGINSPFNLTSVPIAEEMGIVCYVYKSKQAILINDVHDKTQEWSSWYHPYFGTTESELSVPIVKHGENRVLGIINIESTEKYHFTEQHKTVMIELSRHVASILRSVQAFEKLRAIESLTNVLVENEDFHEGLEHILDLAVALTGAKSGSLRLVNREGTALRPIIRKGETTKKSTEEIPIGAGVVGRAFKNKAFILIGDVQPLLEGKEYLVFNPKTRSELAVPIVANLHALGVINLEHHEPYNFDSEDARFIMSLAGFASLLILYEKKNEEELLNEKREAVVSIVQHLAHEVKSSLSGIASILLEIISPLKENNDFVAERIEAAYNLASYQANKFDRIFNVLGFHFQNVDLNEIVEDCFFRMKESKPDDVVMEVSFFKENEKERELQVCVDKMLIISTIDNLIANAFDALREIPREGKVVISVMKEENMAIIEVLDNGKGVREDIRKTLFLKPTSARRDSKNPYRGLGLYLSNKLCMLMGGGIKYDYDELRQLGSRFVLFFPLTEKCDKYNGVQIGND